MGKMRYCEQCGSPLTENCKFCDNCGAAVRQEPGRDQDSQLFTPRRPARSAASRKARERQASPQEPQARPNGQERPLRKDVAVPNGQERALRKDVAGPNGPERPLRKDMAGPNNQERALRRDVAGPISEAPQGFAAGDRSVAQKKEPGANRRGYGGSYEESIKTVRPDRPPRRDNSQAPSPRPSAPRPPYRPQTGGPKEEGYWQRQDQKSRFRQEELETDWEQSWDRELSPEEERGLTPVQYFLLAVLGILVIALVTFLIFWAVGRTKKSSEDRQNSLVTENRQEETVKNKKDDGDVITILDENGQPMTDTQTTETQPAAQTEKQTEAPAPAQTETQPQTAPQSETQPQTAAQSETQPIEILDNTQDVSAASPGDYILPDSSSRLLTDADVAGLSYDDLQMAINEIYARHGRIFTTPEIKAYFEGKSWYTGTADADHFDETVFSDIENQNIQFLVAKMG